MGGISFGWGGGSKKIVTWGGGVPPLWETLDVYIPHRKYHVNPHSSPLFEAACADALVNRNRFFHLCQKDKSSDSKVKACVCYFLSKIYFSPNDSSSRTMKNIFYFI